MWLDRLSANARSPSTIEGWARPESHIEREWLVTPVRTYSVMLFTLVSLLGCTYTDMVARRINYKAAPSLEKARRAVPEDNVLVWGWLLRPSLASPKNTYVVAVSSDLNDFEVVAADKADSGGIFWLMLPKAEYTLFAFSDLDDDGVLERDEVVGRTTQRVAVERTATNRGFIPPLDIFVQSESIGDAGFDVKLQLSKLPQGRLPSVIKNLADQRFDADVGYQGMVMPAEFFQATSPVYFLGQPDFSGDRIPIIFVHGIDATPRTFKSIVAQLDLSRYQVWFYYFPSGARLDTSARLLYEIFLSGHVIPKMPTVVITAHSMGGLVVRQALNYEAEHIRTETERRRRSAVGLFVSFVTPYGGVRTANMGLKMSPVRVASWLDVASSSSFVQRLHRLPLAKNTHFCLFVACSDGDSDGVISLESQLYEPTREAADEVFSYRATHVGILKDQNAVGAYLHLLDRVLLSREAPDAIIPPLTDAACELPVNTTTSTVSKRRANDQRSVQ